MSEFGLKIKNIKAGTLFGYNQGVRNRYDYTEAMFSNSLFSDYIIQNGLNVWNDTSTRDIICLDFDFGSRSYEEEMDHLLKQFGPFEHDKSLSEESKERIRAIFRNVIDNKDNYMKCSKDEIREIFYENGVNVEYISSYTKKEGEKKTVINYKMLYRNSSKAKVGQVMFINSKLYKKAYNWLTMGLGKKMPMENAKIVEMSAYAPLTTSTIVGKFYCPVEAILIIKDTDSFYKTIAKIVKAEDYVVQEKVLDETATEIAKQRAIAEGKFLKDGVTPKYTKRYKRVNVIKKKCVVHDEETEVKNTLWDGEMLIESDILPEWVNGMALLRQHFFKACGIRTHIQLFFKDWCEKTGHDYETYAIQDMFGVWHKLKDIRMITTDNAIKWKKFMNLMGNTPAEAYKYWCDRVNADGSYWGIVKTDHPSKLGGVQQMSYQMVNTLPSYNIDVPSPCSTDDVRKLAKTSVDYVEGMKDDNNLYVQYLRKNATIINHYEMLADLYDWNKDFGNSTWFRLEKRKIINQYVTRLRTGKITIDGDNLTIFGNPYALLLKSVGMDPELDPTVYVSVGGAGSSSSTAAGFNGGGTGISSGRGGGGATDVRIGQNSLYSRVIVAGGGGGAGVTSANANPCGCGGGEYGGDGYYNNTTGSYTTGQNRSGGSASQTAGGITWSTGTQATFGQGGNASGYSCGGGGGGWYGGGGAYDSDSDSDGRWGGGGSGYVYTSSTAKNYPNGCLLNSTHYLTNAQTIAGDTSFTSPTGSVETGHTGNGFCRITNLNPTQYGLYVKTNSGWKHIDL